MRESRLLLFPLRFRHPGVITILLITGMAAAGAPVLWRSFNLGDEPLRIAALLLTPLLLRVQRPGEYSFRFGLAAAVAATGYVALRNNSFLQLAFLYLCFYVVESRHGKLNRLAWILPFLMLSATTYFASVFSFPIRLWLTDAAASLLSWMGFEILTQGNIIHRGTETFSVDSACLGLKMITTSLIVCALFLSRHEHRMKSDTRIAGIVLAFFSAILFVLLSNLLRIVALILFRAPAESFSHELIGLICFAAFTALPLFYITRFTVKWFRGSSGTERKNRCSGIQEWAAPALFGALLLLPADGTSLLPLPAEDIYAKTVNLPGYTKSWPHKSISKFSGPDALVYMKQLRSAFAADHNPMMCWQGSGYTIIGEHEKEFRGHQILFAHLVREGSIMHTAWWFENDSTITTSQGHWRWDMLQTGNAWRLVNVTSDTEAGLKDELDMVIFRRGVTFISENGNSCKQE